MKDLFYLMLVLSMTPVIVVEWIAFLKILMDYIEKEDDNECE